MRQGGRGGWTQAASVLKSWKKKAGADTDKLLILNQIWDRELGQYARFWTLAGVRHGWLYVRPRSPAAAQELQMRRQEIVKGLNKYFKYSWIKGIRTSRE